MPRAQVAPTSAFRLEAEVRGLVPAVARICQQVDHLLEVRLHRLRLACQLRSVLIREPRSWLRFELVPRQVLGCERQRFGQVTLEVGGALTRNPVQQVERDVVKSGTTQTIERAPDDIWSGAPLQHLQ